MKIQEFILLSALIVCSAYARAESSSAPTNSVGVTVMKTYFDREGGFLGNNTFKI